MHRDAAASDVLGTGHAGAGLVASGARLSAESWGTVLPFAVGVATSADVYAGGITVDLQGKVVNAADALMLRNFTVVRLP